MLRPDWDTYFMGAAYWAATRATCNRKHVGAVIVSPEKRIVATGYNGAPRGMPSCDDVEHELVDGHCVRTIHSEANAITFAGTSARGCAIYCTCSPCYDCAKLIANAGISKVVYDEFYGSRYGKSDKVTQFLRDAGITVEQLDHPSLTLFKTLLKEYTERDQQVRKLMLIRFECGCEVPGLEAGETCLMHGASRARDESRGLE